MKRASWLLVGVVAWTTSCGDADPYLERERIFVDPAAIRLAQGELPVATIGAETRYVFRGHPRANVLATFGTEIPVGGTFSRSVQLPPTLAGAQRVVTDGRYQRLGRSHAIPRRVRKVENNAAGASVRLDVRFPAKAAGERVPVVVTATVLPAADRNRHQTEAFRVPADARLEFAYGILELARDQGPVEFQLEVCSAGDCAEVFRGTHDPLQAAGAGGALWIEESVSLLPWADRDASLRLTTTRLRDDPDGFSLPVWSTPTLYVSGQRTPTDTNLILISLDTLRADHLNSYGYPLETAPFLEQRFGRQGTVVERHVAAAATTAPAHMTAFTGLHPSAHGVKAGQLRKLAPGAVTLAEQLRAHGFRTGAVTENAALIIGRGFARGFDTYTEDKSPTVFLPRGQIELMLQRAREWLVQNGDKRFFLFLHTYQVHYPYSPDAEYQDLFAEVPGKWKPPPQLPKEFDPRRYDREIRFTDDRLREFFGVIEELGLGGDTIFVVTSDHGEEFGEHGFIGHGPTLNREITHIPLMLQGPGIAAGRRVPSPLGQIGLAPTLLELLGVEPLPTAQGRSFAGALVGAEGATAQDSEPIYSESWVPTGLALDMRRLPRPKPALSVQLGERKLIRYGMAPEARYQYFDLRRDPEEAQDRYAMAPEEAADLRELLDTYLSEQEAERDALATATARPPQRETRPSEVDPEQAAKLRALGYVD